MKILLDEFEHQIDETILKRGFDYFKKGYITDVDEPGDGTYEITVEGSEAYTVNLNIKGNAVTEFECNCPYDRGPVCKHIVAALFYLQKNTLGSTKLGLIIIAYQNCTFGRHIGTNCTGYSCRTPVLSELPMLNTI